MTRISTALGDKLRDLAKLHPSCERLLIANAEAFDEAYEGYFRTDPPTLHSDEFVAVWATAHGLHRKMTSGEAFAHVAERR